MSTAATNGQSELNRTPTIEATGTSDNALKATATLKAPDDKTKELGKAIVLSGDGRTLAVSAPKEGAVYIYLRHDTDWQRQANIKIADIPWYYGFGDALALSHDGRTLAVSVVNEPSAATGIDGDAHDTSADMSGAVYIFSRDEDEWSQQAYVKASNTDAKDAFGDSLALSANGDVLAVGAPWEDSRTTRINGDQSDNSAEDAGAVYIYTRKGTSWRQQAYIKASNTKARDGFGYSVDLSDDGDTLAIGAISESAQINTHRASVGEAIPYADGAAYIYYRQSNHWEEQAYLKIATSVTGGQVGYDIDVSGDGNTLAVSAPYRNPLKAKNDPGKHVIAVAVFTRKHNVWSRPTYVTSPRTQAGDWFGNAIALDTAGRTLAVGAPFEDHRSINPVSDQPDSTSTDSGAVYLFSRETTRWRRRSYMKAPNTNEGDRFGYDVALSSDGDTLAISAPHKTDRATGNSDKHPNKITEWSGIVYLYRD